MVKLSKRRREQSNDDFYWETGFRHAICTIIGIVVIVILLSFLIELKYAICGVVGVFVTIVLLNKYFSIQEKKKVDI